MWEQSFRGGRSFRFACRTEEILLVEDLLAAQGISCQREIFHPLAARALSDAHAPALGASVAHFFGLIYIQDFASMLPPLALAPPTGARVLDMCASPGGKSGFLASMIGLEGLLIANEPNPARLAMLRQNMNRENRVQVVTSAYKGQELPLPDNSCPYILLDAPCSGWGTEKKHPGIKKLWHGQKIAPLIALQKLLLQKASSLLAPGGRLIYSTCTTNERENEAQIDFALRCGLVIEPLGSVSDFVCEFCSEGFWKVDGEKSGSQDFFVASLRKPPLCEVIDDSHALQDMDTYPLDDLGKIKLNGFIPDWALVFKHGLKLLRREELLFLVPAKAAGLPRGFQWQGLRAGHLAGGQVHINPRLRLLLPPYSRQSGFINIEDATPLEALLSGQSIKSATGLASGWNGLYFRGLPLGLLKIRDKRIIWTDR